MTIEKKYQAIAPETQHFKQEAFTSIEHTEIRWLGNSSHLINSRGTCIMVDPLLKGFDMPLLRETPILPEEVPVRKSTIRVYILSGFWLSVELFPSPPEFLQGLF